MSKKIKTIQSENINDFDSQINKHLKCGWELMEGSYSVLDKGNYHQVLVRDEDNYHHIEYYDNGIVKSQGSFKNKLKNGEWIDYYDCGQIENKVNYENGNKQGVRYHYFDPKLGRNVVCCKRTFLDGVEHGEVITFFPNGNIKSEGMLDKGKKSGEVIGYFENGEIQDKYLLKDDEIISGVTYDESGNVVEKIKEKKQSTVEMVERIMRNYKETT
jgi:antitoxin component YwqK of YwqJK toxin-antitoxin module